MTERKLVHVEVSDHVLTMTMDRPEARNALSRQMLAELGAAYRQFEQDDQCWVAVLQAEGPTFCAGRDLKEELSERSAPRNPDPSLSRDGAGAGSTSPFGPHSKPVIACVEGQAWAGGFEMVMACHLVVATTDATFALSEVKRGLMAIGGGLFRLPQRLPANIAMEMILTGAPQPASAMRDLGLVNRLTEPGDARRVARELALLIARNSPVAVQAALEVTSRVIREQWTDADGWAGQDRPFARVAASEDLIEGLRAFGEKRDPVWKGR